MEKTKNDLSVNSLVKIFTNRKRSHKVENQDYRWCRAMNVPFITILGSGRHATLLLDMYSCTRNLSSEAISLIKRIILEHWEKEPGKRQLTLFCGKTFASSFYMQWAMAKLLAEKIISMIDSDGFTVDCNESVARSNT